MSDIYFDLQDELLPLLRAGDTSKCEGIVAARLAGLPKSPFHVALSLSIANSPREVAEYFDGFFQREADRFRVGAAYAEMNAFEINPELWHFDVFAFEEYGGHEDYDWLSDWRSDDYESMAIIGLEELQQVFASDAFHEDNFNDASRVASLLVVTKFQDLIRRSAGFMRRLEFPLLATDHDSDFIYEVRPGK